MLTQKSKNRDALLAGLGALCVVIIALNWSRIGPPIGSLFGKKPAEASQQTRR